ncbi:protocadherin-15-like [Synchiropus picturatus]
MWRDFCSGAMSFYHLSMILSCISFPCLSGFRLQAEKSLLEEAEHQRILSSFSSRALAGHSNGSLHVNLPKSESNVTFLSDRSPLTTHNPVYHDDSPFYSPAASKGGKSLFKKQLFSPSHSEGSGYAWTMPARIRREIQDETPKRQALMGRALWEQQILPTAMSDRLWPGSSELTRLSDSSETKLSVREQARQFEQQALHDLTPRKNDQGTLSPILVRDRDGADVLEVSSETLLSIMDFPYSPTVGRDLPPNIVTQGREPWTLACQKPTPPLLKKFSSSISSYMTVHPCQITVEIIPDPPDDPPPPPPLKPDPASPSTSPISDPPSFPPSPPCSHRPRSSPPPVKKEVVPPPPPPPPPLPIPVSDTSHPVVQFVPPSLPSISSLRPVSERKHPPPIIPSNTVKKELKGILKNIKNLADIERSVANMHSQVDKNCRMPKFSKKTQVTELSDGVTELPDTGLHDKQSLPNETTTSSAVEMDSASLTCGEESPNEVTVEIGPTTQLNSKISEPTDGNEQVSSADS